MRMIPVIGLGLILLVLGSTPLSRHGKANGLTVEIPDMERSGGEYILPYPVGMHCKLLQGNNGPYGHTGPAEFAYDFQMPLGSPVIAARGGEVVKVVESNNDGTRVPGEENVLVIKHSDGTFGRYYHLTKNGVLPSIGDKVAQGNRIALSGNSGASAGPHLHFDVTKGCYDWGCQTIKIEFKNTRENPLRQGEVY